MTKTITVIRVLSGCAPTILALSVAQGQPVNFDLHVNPAVARCVGPNPQAHVQVVRGALNDKLMISLSGITPGLTFDLFTVQRSNLNASGMPDTSFKGFGLAWYQTDLRVNNQGMGVTTIQTILLDQIFGFDADTVPNTDPPVTRVPPTNTFHVGFWFNNPEDAAPCGFDPSNPTPFNGEHKAGPLAMISTPVPPTSLGPLCTSPTGVTEAQNAQDPTMLLCKP